MSAEIVETDTVLVNVADGITVRGRGAKPIKVELLAENVNVFLTQMASILDKSPEQVGKFKLTEFTVSAEISAKGALVILGTGGEVEGKSGLTFKFERQ